MEDGVNEKNDKTIIDALFHWHDAAPHSVVLTDGDLEFDFASLVTKVDEAARRLIALGAERQDRIIIVGDNTWQWVVAYLATMRIGAIAVPMNNRLAPVQVSELIDLLEARIALADDTHVPMFKESRRIRVLSINGTAAEPLDSIAQSAGDLPSAPMAEEVALISFTSGTTGMPKGAVIEHGALLKASAVYVNTMDFGPGTSTLIVAPLFHNTGFVDQLNSMILCGGRADLLLRYRTHDAIAAFKRRPASFVTAVPSVLRLLMTAAEADAAYGPAKDVLFGGSPMPAPWSMEMHSRWPGTRLWHGYGLTEFTSCCTLLPSEMILTHGESIGYPASGVHLRLVNEEGNDVADGEVGEIWVAGATRMREYWKRPDVTAEKISGEWLRTGDLAERRELGLLYHVGRRDDVINRGGEKVLPSFVEAIMAELPEVAQGVVFAIPNPILQNSVMAAVEPRPGATVNVPAALELLRSRLPGYAVPEQILVNSDLPRTASGKIDRRAVRAAYIASLEAQDKEKERI
jgi:acyl-CoA synthetase (AMP-forming)/AMP-acid ligase II